MDKFKKYGEMYIKFDENNEPEYGFIVDGENNITKYVNLSVKDHKKIILPSLVYDYKFYGPSKSYLRGKVIICEGCFDWLRKVEIIVPFKNSIAISEKAFCETSEVGLVVPEGYGLRKIMRTCNDGVEKKRDEWVLVADKTMCGEFSFASGDDYAVSECDNPLPFYVREQKQENSENEK